jgi:hypothetical protein
MFGTSIVFTPGRTYQRDEDGNKVIVDGLYDFDEGDVFVECDALHACDTVDEPAANDGLFSRFATETIAGQMTEFLDLHPQVWDAISSNPSIVEVLGSYGAKMDEFVEAYRSYRGQEKEPDMADETKTVAETTEELSVVEQPDAVDTPVAETSEDEPLEVSEPEEVVESDEAVEGSEELEASEVAESTPVEEPEPVESLSREEFVRIADEFGAEIAAQTVKDGGDYYSALAAHAKAVSDENELLKAKVAELSEVKAGQPAKVTAAPERTKKPLIRIQGRS